MTRVRRLVHRLAGAVRTLGVAAALVGATAPSASALDAVEGLPARLVRAWEEVRASEQALDEMAQAQPSDDDLDAAQARLFAAYERLASALTAEEWLALPAEADSAVAQKGLWLIGSYNLERDPALSATAFARLLDAFGGSEIDRVVRAQLLPEAILRARPPADAVLELDRVRSQAPGGQGVSVTLAMADALALAGRLDEALQLADQARAAALALPDDDPHRAFAVDDASCRAALLGQVVPAWTPLATLGPETPCPTSGCGPTVLAYMEPWCLPCLQGIPDLNGIVRRHPDARVVGLTRGGAGVMRATLREDGTPWDPRDEAVARMLRVRREHGPEFPIVVVDDTFPRQRGIQSVPVYLVVDDTSRVRVVVSSSGRGWLLERAVTAVGRRARLSRGVHASPPGDPSGTECR